MQPGLGITGVVASAIEEHTYPQGIELVAFHFNDIGMLGKEAGIACLALLVCLWQWVWRCTLAEVPCGQLDMLALDIAMSQQLVGIGRHSALLSFFELFTGLCRLEPGLSLYFYVHGTHRKTAHQSWSVFQCHCL
ncbi:hypothetical protein D3C76_1161780 [compost metagenome]